MTRLNLTVAMAAMFLTWGCAEIDDDWGSGESNWEATITNGPSAEPAWSDPRADYPMANNEFTYMVDFGSLEGTIGDVAVNGDATIRNWWWGEGWTSFELIVTTPHGAGMTIVNLWGDPSMLYDSGLRSEISSITGCSGPEVDLWTYDHTADETTNDVEPDPMNTDTLHVVFESSFSAAEVWDEVDNVHTVGASAVTGEFTLHRIAN